MKILCPQLCWEVLTFCLRRANSELILLLWWVGETGAAVPVHHSTDCRFVCQLSDQLPEGASAFNLLSLGFTSLLLKIWCRIVWCDLFEYIHPEYMILTVMKITLYFLEKSSSSMYMLSHAVVLRNWCYKSGLVILPSYADIQRYLIQGFSLSWARKGIKIQIKPENSEKTLNFFTLVRSTASSRAPVISAERRIALRCVFPLSIYLGGIEPS